MKNFVLASFVASGLISFAQPQNPVSWSASYKPLSETEGEIVIKGTIEKGWHTYSQRPTEAGPIPTSFTFTPTKDYEPDGPVAESDAHEEFVPAFDARIYVFTGVAEFRQKIKRKNKGTFSIPMKVEYMTCNDMMCLPPKTVSLSVRAQ
jgi:DsbC/DsbD-like thiol-disulfide interchange protein